MTIWKSFRPTWSAMQAEYLRGYEARHVTLTDPRSG